MTNGSGRLTRVEDMSPTRNRPPDKRIPQRAPDKQQHKNPFVGPDRVRFQITRSHDRHRDAQPRWILPTTTRPSSRTKLTHGNKQESGRKKTPRAGPRLLPAVSAGCGATAPVGEGVAKVNRVLEHDSLWQYCSNVVRAFTGLDSDAEKVSK